MKWLQTQGIQKLKYAPSSLRFRILVVLIIFILGLGFQFYLFYRALNFQFKELNAIHQLEINQELTQNYFEHLEIKTQALIKEYKTKITQQDPTEAKLFLVNTLQPWPDQSYRNSKKDFNSELMPATLILPSASLSDDNLKTISASHETLKKLGPFLRSHVNWVAISHNDAQSVTFFGPNQLSQFLLIGRPDISALKKETLSVWSTPQWPNEIILSFPVKELQTAIHYGIPKHLLNFEMNFTKGDYSIYWGNRSDNVFLFSITLKEIATNERIEAQSNTFLLRIVLVILQMILLLLLGYAWLHLFIKNYLIKPFSNQNSSIPLRFLIKNTLEENQRRLTQYEKRFEGEVKELYQKLEKNLKEQGHFKEQIQALSNHEALLFWLARTKNKEAMNLLRQHLLEPEFFEKTTHIQNYLSQIQLICFNVFQEYNIFLNTPTANDPLIHEEILYSNHALLIIALKILKNSLEGLKVQNDLTMLSVRPYVSIRLLTLNDDIILEFEDSRINSKQLTQRIQFILPEGVMYLKDRLHYTLVLKAKRIALKSGPKKLLETQ